MNLHPTAIIEEGAHLGTGVTVGPHAFIASGAKIGDGCTIGSNAVVYGYTTMGESCRVHAGAVIGGEPQDLAFKPVESFVEIGDRGVFREGVTIHRGTGEGTSTVVGDDVYLMAFSHVGHNTRVGNKVIMVNGALLAGHVEILDGAFLSSNCAVHQFCRVGRLAMLGGNCTVTKDVPSFFTTANNTLNDVAGLNIVGMRRAGMGADDRKAVKAAFKLIYASNLNVTQALQALREQHTEAPVLELCDFIESAKRGICSSSIRGLDA